MLEGQVVLGRTRVTVQAGDHEFKYTIHQEDRSYLTVHRDTLNALKLFANENDMPVVTATFLVIRTGLA